ncbi:amino acid/polyamine transporter I [Tricladium varicosporioides]|nr:amino acid/polyamine transporter I [Hymenoscyphus varicosporioides]
MLTTSSALVVNKMVGTGIFVQPGVVLACCGSKGASLLMWLVGTVLTLHSLSVYLEYGTRFPLTGGELYYIDYIWTKPKLLFTYMYAILLVIIGGSQGNALTFGSSVLLAATPPGTPINHRLQKVFAVLIVGLVCLLQSYSRSTYIRLNNFIAIYKLLFLSFFSVAGWCVLGGLRSTSAREDFKTPYGTANLEDSFAGTTTRPYNYGLALLVIQRAFLGYENANYVLEEVYRPPGDEDRVFRRATRISILTIAFFYIMVNVALFAACTTDELLQSSDLTGLFFSKVFGQSPKSRTASGILVAISAIGNILSITWATVRVKQEIARMGILPYSEFWARSNHRGLPGPALLLHFTLTTIFILATPLSNANGYLVISTLFPYARTWIASLLGLGLLAAPWLKAWKKGDEPWKPRSSKLGYWSQMPLTTIFIVANAFVIVLCWFPANLQSTLKTKSPILPPVVGPAVGTSLFFVGAIYWLWDIKILPLLGYKFEANAERQEGHIVYMSFRREIYGTLAIVADWFIAAKNQYQKWQNKTPVFW